MSYRELKSYQATVVIYDYTVEFCGRYIDRYSRTRDQMTQAARSGKQNIVEGSTQRASKQGELKLLGVARASLQELLEDYEDFLRQKNLRLWEKDSPQARTVRSLAYKSDQSYKSYQSYLANPEPAANAAICLINQANFLLDRQIRILEEKFVREGGYTENLFRKRLAQKDKTYRSYKSDRSD